MTSIKLAVRTHAFAGLACIALIWPSLAFAQTDEIQVYDGSLAPMGVFNLTWHNNYTPKGIKTPSSPGGITPDQSFNGVTEWAYGFNDWLELGLYLPLYSIDKNEGLTYDGFKLRTLFAVPRAEDRKFFYGVGFELSFNDKQWDTSFVTSEIRPIIGWHFDKVDLIFNPDLDTAYDGISHLEFTPSMRLAYNVSPEWAVAMEEYSDFGPLRDFYSPDEQSHELFAVADYGGGPVEVETGVGFGMTDASDDVTLKLILSRDLN